MFEKFTKYIKPKAELSNVPVRWWEAILVGVPAFVILYSIGGIIVLVLSGVEPGSVPPFGSLLLGTLLGQVLFFVFLLLYVKLRGKQSPFRALGFRSVDMRRAAPALLLAIVAVVLLELILVLALPETWLVPNAIFEGLGGAPAGQIILGFVSLCVFAPLVEEAFVRGFLLSAVSKRFGLLIGAITSSAVFGLLHLPSLYVVTSAFFGGLILSWMYKKTGSILPGIVLHVIYNTVTLVLALTIGLYV